MIWEFIGHILEVSMTTVEGPMMEYGADAPVPDGAEGSDAPRTTPAPVCAVFLRSNGAGEVLVNKDSSMINSPDLASARRQAVGILVEAAKKHGGALLAICSDPEGLFRLVIQPNGTVTEAPREPGFSPPSTTATTPSYTTLSPRTPPTPPPIPRSQPFITQPINPGVNLAPPVVPRHAFVSSDEGALPAEQGWRGALARRGLPLPPSEAELSDRNYRTIVAQHWPTPRTISVVNGKGGAGKTPTTICLAAVFARYGGAGVLAWDNNQTRGTLGWRTEQSPHEATLLDLLPETPRLLRPDAQASDLAQFVHHQSRDYYDVLRSKSVVLADEQRITPEDVDAIWKVLTKFYRLIIMDSGNDESDPMWRRMIDHTDQLVTVTTTREDHAEAGALLLEALSRRDEHSAQLARDSVTIITQADPKATDESIQRIRDGYSTISRDVAFIPYDPAMVEGALSYDLLKPATQRAWLMAAACVAEGLTLISLPNSSSSHVRSRAASDIYETQPPNARP